jgi:hypothetical protein
MRRRCSRGRAGARPTARAAGVLLAALATPAAAQEALGLARLSLVERRVELERPGAGWQAAVEGAPMRLGEAVRTGQDATARLELPWMSLTLGPGSVLRFPDATLLQATLDAGRAVLDSPGREALKLVTREAEVYGRGRAVVRREGRATMVSCLSGRFQVAAGGGVVSLAPGHGSVVAAGRGPGAAEPVPEPPARGLWPADDPAYVERGATIALRWDGNAAFSYQVELLPVGADVVLLQRDVLAPPARVEIPWDGAFRWRVSSRDSRGLEGPPSAEGLIAVEPR